MAQSSMKAKRLVFQCVFGFFALVLPFHHLLAESGELSAADVTLHTPKLEPEFKEFSPRLGKYTYDVSWQGIPAATATLSVYQEGDRLFLFADAKTVKFIDIFYKLRYQADGIISAENYFPERIAIDQHENSRHKLTEIFFGAGGDIKSVRKRLKRNKKPKEETLEFHSENTTLGPFSAAFLARSIDWRVGEERSFDAFNGKSRYLIKFKVISRGKEKINGELRKVLVLAPSVQNVTKPKAKSKLDYATIYLSDDPQREVLEIRSKVFIGTVRTKLAKFEPLEETTSLRASLRASPLADVLLK